MEWVFDWISQYGYFAIFGLLMVGIFGIPVPDELLLVFVGYLVWNGDLHLALALPSAVAGSCCGITASYGLGRSVGRGVILRVGRYVHVTPERLDKVHAWFEHLGKWTLTFGYFVPGVRHVTAIVAGTSKMPWHHFALFAYGGALLWASMFISLGYFLGTRWRTVGYVMMRHLRVGALVLVGLVVLYALVHWRIVKRRAGGRGE